MELDAYLHITSPIRRLVDLLNMIRIQINIYPDTISDTAFNFYKKWATNMEYINTSMRSIRKVQNDCALVHTVTSNPDTLTKIWNGYVFDRIDRTGLWQYNVYIPELKLVSKITTGTKIDNYQETQFNIHLFVDEDCVKRKVRLSLRDTEKDYLYNLSVIK